jgi:hypothetical protein
MKRVLITGADGFIGANLARHMLQDGQEVHNGVCARSQESYNVTRPTFGTPMRLPPSSGKSSPIGSSILRPMARIPGKKTCGGLLIRTFSAR